MKWLIPVAITAAAVLLYRQLNPARAQDLPPVDGQTQETSFVEDMAVQAQNLFSTRADVAPDVAQANRRAFLDMIAYSEGTSGPNGYRTMFGGGLFSSWIDHPRQTFPFTDKLGNAHTTTAAGRYQFLARTWDGLRDKLNLTDFSPDSQDAAALELVRQRGALDDVDAGRLDSAIAKCAPIWASLPGAGYNQPERKLASLQAAYSMAGGQIEVA